MGNDCRRLRCAKEAKGYRERAKGVPRYRQDTGARKEGERGEAESVIDVRRVGCDWRRGAGRSGVGERGGEERERRGKEIDMDDDGWGDKCRVQFY